MNTSRNTFPIPHREFGGGGGIGPAIGLPETPYFALGAIR